MGRVVLVCGSRNYTDRGTLFETLDELHTAGPIGLLVHGGAKGADELASAWAHSRDVPTQRHDPDWPKHGRGAGPIRNQMMLDEGKPELVVAFPSVPCGPGTADMMRRSRKAGVEVLVVED